MENSSLSLKRGSMAGIGYSSDACDFADLQRIATYRTARLA
jgi:hypothetical protein